MSKPDKNPPTDRPRSRTTEPPNCPKCGPAGRVVPIVYGYPGPGLEKEVAAGRVVLGGCLVSDDNPIWHCLTCGGEWGKYGQLRQ